MEQTILASKKRSTLEMVYDLLWQLRKDPFLAKTRACMLANLTWDRTEVIWTILEKAGLVEEILRPRTSYHRGPGRYIMSLTEKGRLFLSHVEAARKLLQLEG